LPFSLLPLFDAIISFSPLFRHFHAAAIDVYCLPPCSPDFTPIAASLPLIILLHTTSPPSFLSAGGQRRRAV
jgi:hypothetical protein